MRARQFFALNMQIGHILKEEEARGLAITHHGKPGERIKELMSEIHARRKSGGISQSSLAFIHRGEAKAASAGAIEAERERQRAASEEMMQDKEAWIRKIQEQRAKELAQSLAPSET